MEVHSYLLSMCLLVSTFLTFPMIGSRSLGSSGSGGGGVSVVSLDNLDERGSPKSTISEGGVGAASDEEAEIPMTGVNGNSSSAFSSSVQTTPCSLVTMSLLDGRDGRLMAYDDKTLITVSHDIFDVSQGIVPTIVYQVVLEIPSGHEFSLEFWLNGLTEERGKQKRRHQRDRRDTLLELYPQNSHTPPLDVPPGSSSSSGGGGSSNGNGRPGTSSFIEGEEEPFVFCSKDSLAGVNREASAKQLKFHWYVNGNNLVPQASVSGLPSNVIFRLRFRSVVEATASVFEQNLSVIVRSDCYLQLKVEDNTKLTLDSLWNPKMENTGLNCTVFIVPKKNFGLEINLSSLSVYGMRDICKDRHLQFTKVNARVPSSSSSSLTSFPLHSSSDSTSSSNTVSTGNNSKSGSNTSKQKYLTNNSNFLEPVTPFEFQNPIHEDSQDQNQQHLSPLERKFCGKLEDYSESERTLTFPSTESSALIVPAPAHHNPQQDNEVHSSGSGTSSSTLNSSNNSQRRHYSYTSSSAVWGVYLTVQLPVAVKSRESFAFDLTALSPCQRVTLNGLDGQLKYSKHYENDQCSVVIHVPYGNIILAQIAVSSQQSSSSKSDSNGDSRHESVKTGGSAPITNGDFITSISTVDDAVLTTVGERGSSREAGSETPPEDVFTSGSSGGGGGGGTGGSVSVSTKNESVPITSSSSNGIDEITRFYTTGYSADDGGDGSEEKSRKSDVVATSYHESQLALYENGEEEIFDNSIPISSSSSSSTTSYECPVRDIESNDIESANSEGGGGGDDDVNGENAKRKHKYLLIQAVDLVSGSEFNWCFDASKQNSAHKRAWKSFGNRVSINFRMSHFDTFILTYQSVKIPELAGDCERGWVKLADGTCVTVMERALRWTDAEESCQMRGGHLATVKSDLSENKLAKMIAESPLFHPTRAYWIGANDRESEGNFQWTSGLPFQYKNWFPGWTHQGKSDRSEILSAQPNDDGWSGQDCVEIRQIDVPEQHVKHSSSSSTSDNAFATFILKSPTSSDTRSANPRVAVNPERGYHHISQQQQQFAGQGLNSHQQVLQQRGEGESGRFYWNDRNCDVKNFYLCEKGTHQNVDVSCNRTLKLSPPQVTSMVVTSPAYPSAYPDNIVCVTSIETIPGFKLVLSFDEFILEDSPSCQYDSLEILEVQSDSGNVGSTTTVQSKETKQQKISRTTRDSRVNNSNNINSNKQAGRKICGDWTKKLKLLRYTTASKSTQVILKFESDFSHHFPGFKVKVTVEKDMEQQCMEQQMQRYGNHCYLVVSFPAVPWSTAHQICSTLKGNLASILSAGEWGFISQTLLSTPDYDKKSIYWLGGSIDQNNQLGWVDHMPFNFSGFHPSDLQTRYDFRCLSVYWHDGGGGKGDLAWRLTECSQNAGYICKKRAQVEMRQFLNRTFSGTGGKLASPNYPSNYVNNMDHRNHLVAPKSTKIVIRFSHLDIEPQENCLYDYIEIVDWSTKNRTRFCGNYQRDELNRLDYVSSSNEVDVIFHTDFSNTFTGYELLWRAVDVTSCMSGKTVLAGFVGSPFPLGDQTIHTPNFPYFNLPHLDCVYHIVAPAGQRLWLSFQVFELGQSLSSTSLDQGIGESGGDGATSWTGIDCLQQDHVSIDLTGMQNFSPAAPAAASSDGKLPLLTDLASDNEILICGNLTSKPFLTSFISYSERVTIRVRSPQGRTGRGFLGRFKAIPHILRETLTVNTEPNSTLPLTSLNFPMEPPPAMANLTVSFIAPPQYVITLKVIGTTKCNPSSGSGIVKSYLEIMDPYVGKHGLTRIICHLRESTFTPSYTIDDDGNGGSSNKYASTRNFGGGSGSRNNGYVGNNRLMKNDDIFELVGDANNQEEVEEGATMSIGGDNGNSMGNGRGGNMVIRFRSRFNRLDVKQVYLVGFHGKKWNAQVLTTLDENFRDEVIADGDRLLLLNTCTPNICANGGTCVTDKGRNMCRCPPPFTGPFCALSLCDMNPCLFGECVMEGKSFKCKCQLGYGGERCERRYKPCDDRPCSGHGDCIEVNKTSYKCLCHAWWEGPQCESRMLHIPYKPLSQRMIEEPFWLGLITVFVVMGVIGLIWCLKRHFPEKLEKFLSEDLERNRGISWAPSSVRTGGVVGPGPLGIRDAIPGTSQQAASPPTTRSFLGRLGIRKPSLLSLSSATSNVSATVASPHTYENRTFSLDDLLRPSRGMLRTPSPHRRRNYSVQVRRDPAEKQQILQQLVSPGPSSSFDGESKPATPKPTLAEIIQMSEKRLRLASQSSMQEPQPSTSAAACSNNSSIDSVTSQHSRLLHGQDSAETSFTNLAPQTSSMQLISPAQAAATKAEKKVTFAHMLDKLAAGEMTSSSSCSDVSCGEESKIIVTVPVKPVGKKDRKSRFRRSKNYRSRTSEEDGNEISSSDTTPDPMYAPRFPLKICISPTNTTGPSVTTSTASSSFITTTAAQHLPTVPTSLSAKSSSGKLHKIASADSLLSLFRRFSGSSSAPPSPQYSENEESSAGATPLSTPSSPRNSQLSLRPPGLVITTAESNSNNNTNNNNSNNNNNTIELPVIDPFSLAPAPGSNAAWTNQRSNTQTITLEVPMRDYCLSPIHEVPTPLPTPSHSPAHTPMMRRPSHNDGIPMIKVQSSEDDDSFVRREYTPENIQSTPRKLSIPVISISVEDPDNDGRGEGDGSTRRDDEVDIRITVPKRKFFPSGPGEPEMIPDVLIDVPPDASLESGGGRPGSELPSSSSSCASAYGIAATHVEAGIDSSGPGPPPQSPQGKFKPRPPPLVFANEILTSTSSKNSKDDDGHSTHGSTSSTSSTNSDSSCCNSSCSTSSSSSTSTISSCSGTGGDNVGIGIGPPTIVIDEGESTCDGGPTTTTTNTNTNSTNNNNNSDRSEVKVLPVESAVPVLSIEFATPVSEQLPKFVTSPSDDASTSTSISTTLSDKTPAIEVVSCMAVPHIWDCPLAPPMITINQSSEAESDSDTTVQKSLLRRPNLNFLSPFASDTIRVPSESNLSTSGYSSMASPCASRCPSVSPLCSAEMDDYSPHHCPHSTGHGSNCNNQLLMRRASLTPSTPKKPTPSPIRRSSLNSGTPLMSFSSNPGVHGGMGLFDKRSLSEEKYEEDKKKLQEVDVETDSAFEIETDLECQPSNTVGGTLEELTGSNMTLSPPEEHDTDLDVGGGGGSTDSKTPVPPVHLFSTPIAIYPEERKCINNLLQVPKKGFPKSRSLDINSTMINDPNGGTGAGATGTSSSTGNSGGGRLLLGHSSPSVKLKGLGPSLDSKLNFIDPVSLNAKLRNISGSSSVSSTSSGNGSGGGGTTGGPGITISLPLSAFPSKCAAVVAATTVHCSSSGSGSSNFIEIPDDSCKDRRLSPVSSRSESPLSELSCTVGGRSYMACPGSPVTDSDGMYDYPSSEVLSNNNESQMSIPARLASLNKLSPQQQLRRSGRRKDRRLGKGKGGTLGTAINVPSFNAPGVVSSSTNLPPPLIPSPVLYTPASQLSPSSEQQSSLNKVCSGGETDAAAIATSPVIVPSSSISLVSGTDAAAAAAASSNQLIFPHIDLPPSLARESLVPVVAINKRASPKRRVRAQPALDVSSSSSESLSSRSRSRTSVSSFQHSICSSPKRSMEEVEASYGALSDSAIGKGNSVSDVVSKDVTDAHGGAQPTKLGGGEDDSVPCSSKRVRESSPKPDVIQQQPTSSTSFLGSRSQGQTNPSSPARRKISRLRTISHQIRFLRRLELSLIRKKECLTAVNRTQEILSASSRHDSIIARSDSWDTSREDDLSDSSAESSCGAEADDNDNISGCGDGDDDGETKGLLATDKPLMSRSSSSPGTLCYKGPSNKGKPKGGGSHKLLQMDLLDNCSAAELLSSHKRRLRKYN